MLVPNEVVGDNPAAGGTGLTTVTGARWPLAIEEGRLAVAIELGTLAVGALVALNAGLAAAASGCAT